MNFKEMYGKLLHGHINVLGRKTDKGHTDISKTTAAGIGLVRSTDGSSKQRTRNDRITGPLKTNALEFKLKSSRIMCYRYVLKTKE